jgi:hypothetical protein
MQSTIKKDMIKAIDMVRLLGYIDSTFLADQEASN